jgi:RNA 3'-terminal phosphate cyclase (ATP)
VIVLDGSQGEGGGQILRTSLALSLVTGLPFRLENVRARREKPGLRRQHLTGVLAAAAVGEADVEGARVDSREVTFRPRRLVAGEHAFDVGTAGSAPLVLQAILPALLQADAPSRVTVTGGTQAKHSPPFDFLERTFLPLVSRMGPRVAARLERRGFFPAGGGRIVLDVEPARLRGLELLARGAVTRVAARAIVSKLPPAIAARELAVVAAQLGWPADALSVEQVHDAISPGNLLLLEATCPSLTEVVTGFGERGVPAERVASIACAEMQRWLGADVPVGGHLADQIIVPLALAGEGAYRTFPLSLHATTNFDVVRRFLDVDIAVEEAAGGAVLVRVRR